MAPKSDHSMPLRAVRQLRRIRAFYATAALLWAALAAWEGWKHPGSRPMWVSLLLLVVFMGLLSVTSLWLWRHQTVAAGEAAHQGAPRGMAPRPGNRLSPGT
ncbi:hypothetical protein PV733_36125 [Streptomyces europaeiscabiei]|uniref:Integral membrane protein n=1 Tax=Streptomyces europaeiscabiei TaxID=146819 RepID=A0ABU4NE57_9ACTN|nr:hypothetical protein [Streptomyces europaeiscabiei]MDX2526253.1 hypothetical protein [Streptomyces europaeiscabiei]MDX2766067.1 hypothetical protein [Streptomyces europaeiscabiei]MDX2773528.1 hypothetical protein [Streptomyces europaeiscabiei]MDX3549411.1 hypothetical protein [Streptomyces europaeiscabiei]MDX3552074.1 hypothetical protein [Streptomyces europaeiscabiei]